MTFSVCVAFTPPDVCIYGFLVDTRIPLLPGVNIKGISLGATVGLKFLYLRVGLLVECLFFCFLSIYLIPPIPSCR